MKRRISFAVAISSTALLLLQTAQSIACPTGSTTITNLPATSGAGYQVFSMNAAGQLTGFFYVFGEHPPHTFLFSDNQLTDLGTLGGSTSEGHWINATGQITGKADLTGDTQSHAFLRSAGGMTDLGTLGGTSSTGTAINDQGVVIGNSDLSGGTGSSAFICTNGVLTSLGTLGSNYSSALALNQGSLVVGQAGLASGDIHAFAYANGVLSDLGTLGGTYSSAFAVNDAGAVVGESSVNSTDIHGFVFVGGVMTDLGTFGGTYSSAYLVNSNGLAVGVANTADDLETHGFVYSGGAMTDLGTLGGAFSVPNAVNGQGQVVGESATSGGADHAFLWDKGNLIDLNSVLPANSGWELVTALYLNDAGRVVGVGNNAGLSQWFILDLAGGGGSNPPVAVAGPDQIVECQSQVTLDGSHSSTSNNDSLAFEWSTGGTVLGTSAVLTVSLPSGTNVVTLKVSDACGGSAQDDATIVVADVTPPTGSCPAPVVAAADAHCQAPVPNFTSQVVAADNCTPVSALVISQNPPAGTLVGLGVHPVTITVTDASGNSSMCSVLFTVADQTSPKILSFPKPITLSADAHGRAAVPSVTSGVVAIDNCASANPLVLTQNPAAGTLLPTGHYNIAVTVSDDSGNKTSATVTLAIVDTTPPIIQSLTVSPNVLSPPNHQLVPVTVSAVVSDNCDSSPSTKIVCITSSEDSSRGDIHITGDLTAMLAASKDPFGRTRVYTIKVRSIDAAGNCSFSQVTVSVPKNSLTDVPLSAPACKH